MKIINRVAIIILFLSVLPLISADIIIPGYSPIEINNKITNINEFPDYVFVTGADLQSPLLFCSLQLVEEDGTISGEYYKFCSISVYAIKKENWDIEKAGIFMDESETEVNPEEYIEFMNSIEAKKVIKNLDIYKEKPDLSVVTRETNYYAVDLNEVKEKPDRVVKSFNYTNVLIPLLISLIALVIIITIIIKKKGKRSWAV